MPGTAFAARGTEADVRWRPAPAGRHCSDVRSYYEHILPFYELETARREDLSFWRGLAAKERPECLLELGSGLGRVTKVVAPHSRRAVGIDLLWPMVCTASHRAGDAHFVDGDMRSLPFNEAFDLILAPNDPLSHVTALPERDTVLRETARALRPGGLLVLEGLYRPVSAPCSYLRRVELPNGSLTVGERWIPQGEPCLWKAHYCYRLHTPGRTRKREASFLARSWTPESVTASLERAGLVIESLRGDFEARPIGADSRRLVVFARRPGRSRISRGPIRDPRWPVH